MKTIKSMISILLCLLILFGTAALIPVSAAERSREYTEETITAHLYEMDKTAELNCLFFSDMPNTPYISATDFLSHIYRDTFTLTKMSGGVYQITNSFGDTMIVDTVKDTVHFDAFDFFTAMETAAKEGRDPEATYIIESQIEYLTETTGKDIDFAPYRIDLVDVDGNVYFPLSAISDLFDNSYNAARYIDGEIYFTEVMEEEYFDSTSLLDPMREQSTIDETYRELCFVMDNLYGRPPMAQLSKELEEKSFDEWLSSERSDIKNLLLSDRLIDFIKGLAKLDTLAWDGGHTGFCYGYLMLAYQYPDEEVSGQLTAMADDPQDADEQAVQDLVNLMTQSELTKPQLLESRQNAFDKLTSVKKWEREDEETESDIVDALLSGEDNYAELYTAGDTAIFVFDSFEDEVVEPFKWSLDYAKENGIRNFVIDLSANSGGSSAVAMYMLTVMAGFNEIPEKDVQSGNRLKEVGSVDLNLDGVYNDEDNLRYDFHYAILTSRFSFSCGNLMPALARENGIVILGETSGGGTCALTVPSFPNGPAYAVSAATMLTGSDGSDLDDGVQVNYRLTPDTDNQAVADFSKMYDVDLIRNDIEDFYAGEVQKETVMQGAAYTVFTAQQSVVILLIILAVAAAVVVAITVCVIIRKNRYRNR